MLTSSRLVNIGKKAVKSYWQKDYRILSRFFH